MSKTTEFKDGSGFRSRSYFSAIISLSLIFSLLLLISGCSAEDEIKDKIGEANYCDTKEDCAFVGSKCPFGCYIYVNKDRAEEIGKLVDGFDSRCVYDCISCQDVECVENRCKEVCE